jgi:inhibitor of cysteine peptidase
MLTVVAGEPFSVELRSTPTTGYMWELASSAEGVRLLGSEYRHPPDAAIGGGGTQVFRLEARHPGRFDLHFQLRRRWESVPIEKHVVVVVASPA